MWAGEDRGREGGGEAEDLPSPFEDLFVHDLELGWCREDELAGVRESWNKGTP